jgi:hypothetical protein
MPKNVCQREKMSGFSKNKMDGFLTMLNLKKFWTKHTKKTGWILRELLA